MPGVLAVCPAGVRVGAWVRGERPTRSRGPLTAWEPVVFTGGRLRVDLVTATDTSGSPAAATVRAALAAVTPALGWEGPRPDVSPDTTARRLDALVYRPGARRTDPGRVIGAKPAIFARWIFDLLGALPGDEFVDLFPGSGGIARAWDPHDSAVNNIPAGVRPVGCGDGPHGRRQAGAGSSPGPLDEATARTGRARDSRNLKGFGGCIF